MESSYTNVQPEKRERRWDEVGNLQECTADFLGVEMSIEDGGTLPPRARFDVFRQRVLRGLRALSAVGCQAQIHRCQIAPKNNALQVEAYLCEVRDFQSNLRDLLEDIRYSVGRE
jgi:hypothetical protein